MLSKNKVKTNIKQLKNNKSQTNYLVCNIEGKCFMKMNVRMVVSDKKYNRQQTRPTLSLTCEGHNSNYKYEKENCFQKVA